MLSTKLYVLSYGYGTLNLLFYTRCNHKVFNNFTRRHYRATNVNRILKKWWVQWRGHYCIKKWIFISWIGNYLPFLQALWFCKKKGKLTIAVNVKFATLNLLWNLKIKLQVKTVYSHEITKSTAFWWMSTSFEPCKLRRNYISEADSVWTF